MHRVQVTAGGDMLDYNNNTSSHPASLTTVKIHLNSTISMDGDRYTTLDIKQFYYGTPIRWYEYAHI